MLQLPNGDRLVVGSTEMSSSIGHDGPSPHLQIALQALGTVAFPPLNPSPRNPLLLGGNGNDIPEAAAVDPKGNIWIVGITDSDDFRLVNPIVTQKTPYKAVGFVIELDPTGASLLFSTYLGGQQNDCYFPCVGEGYMGYSTSATAIAFDSEGEAYVGGSTDQSDFPTTPGAYLSGKGGYLSLDNWLYYSYLVKISSAGKLIYGTELTTGGSNCDGSSCLGGVEDPLSGP